MATIFKGFSTVNKVKAPYTLTDMALVKQDLLNEFNTRKGERVMRPNFGSIIWDLLMNPDDSFTTDEIKLDIERIKLESKIVAMNDVNTMQLNQISIPPTSPKKSNKRLIVLLAFIGSFMISIFLALIMDALKPDEKTPTA